MTKRSKVRALVPALAVTVAAACSSDAPKAGSDQADSRYGRSAIADFWYVYHHNDYAQIPAVEAELEDAIAEEPGDGTPVAYLAAAHWWHVSEHDRDPTLSRDVLVGDFISAVDLFGQATTLSPDDDHLPGFLGVTMVHLGVAANRPDLVAQGDQIIDEAVARYPEFNNFNRWAAHNADPKDSAAYAKSLDSMWQLIDACIGKTIDRSNPDVTPYLHLQTTVGRKRVCWWGNELAPFAWEGIFLNFGNGLVKAGRTDVARIAYANAKLDPNYENWPYRSELETIMASDLSARAALYADADPSNDPPVTVRGRGCVYCHATVPEP